jgi:hypothetical protein
MQFKILPLLMLTLALTRCQPRVQPITCADCDYFHCKIDGQNFSPDGPWKTDPLDAYTKDGGRHLAMYGRNSGKIVAIEVKTNVTIDTGTYQLPNPPSTGAYYGPNTNSTFRTSPNHKGSLKINSLTETINGVNQPVIKGTFSFMAYDSVSRQQVAITDGEFRIRYRIY